MNDLLCSQIAWQNLFENTPTRWKLELLIQMLTNSFLDFIILKWHHFPYKYNKGIKPNKKRGPPQDAPSFNIESNGTPHIIQFFKAVVWSELDIWQSNQSIQFMVGPRPVSRAARCLLQRHVTSELYVRSDLV